MGRLIIVANRLPVNTTRRAGNLHFSQSPGGLAAGLKSLPESTDRLWLGGPASLLPGPGDPGPGDHGVPARGQPPHGPHRPALQRPGPGHEPQSTPQIEAIKGPGPAHGLPAPGSGGGPGGYPAHVLALRPEDPGRGPVGTLPPPL